MSIMKISTTLLIALATLVTGCQTTGQKSSYAAETKRVGTFRRGDVVLAYYNSVTHAEHLKTIKARRDEAVAAGDEEGADKIAYEVALLQDLAHKQLARNAPLDNILDRLDPHMQTLKREHNLTAIVEEAKAPTDQATVDVTEEIKSHLQSAKK